MGYLLDGYFSWSFALFVIKCHEISQRREMIFLPRSHRYITFAKWVSSDEWWFVTRLLQWVVVGGWIEWGRVRSSTWPRDGAAGQAADMGAGLCLLPEKKQSKLIRQKSVFEHIPSTHNEVINQDNTSSRKQIAPMMASVAKWLNSKKS